MTTYLIWNKLHQVFSSSSPTCISCGHSIEEIQHILIILNGVKGQYDTVVLVIHSSRNPYDLASVSFVLLDLEARMREQIFDPNIYVSVIVVP